MDATNYMRRCFELAGTGLGKVAPNPLVGAVLVYDNRIVAEGFHEKFGTPHAEVNALYGFNDSKILAESILYVNLEPCSHFGKTPPCSDLIISKGIKKVVIANIDPFGEVNGKGILKLKAAGIEVQTGIMEKEGAFLNRRFFTFHKKKRPYLILKWAQTADGFIASENATTITKISNEASNILVHKWRSEEQAILIGKNTALADNPELTVRKFTGINPVRIILDSTLSLPENLNIFNSSASVIIVNEVKNEIRENVEFIKVAQGSNYFIRLFEILYEKNIQSVLIEGGASVLTAFIENGFWDEARVITSKMLLGKGLQAPALSNIHDTIEIDGDKISIYLNKNFS